MLFCIHKYNHNGLTSFSYTVGADKFNMEDAYTFPSAKECVAAIFHSYDNIKVILLEF